MQTSAVPRLPLIAFFVAGLGLALGLSAPTYLMGQALIRAVPSNDVVKVRGVAAEVILLDRAHWTITISSMRSTVEAAYAAADDSVGKVVDYLKRKGVNAAAIELGPHQQSTEGRYVQLDKLGNQKYELTGYRVRREVRLRDVADLDGLQAIERSFAADLRRRGVEAAAGAIRFFYSGDAKAIKARLLDGASTNAYERAQSIAKSSGASLGALRAARQGAFDGFRSDGRIEGSERRHRLSAVITVDYGVR